MQIDSRKTKRLQNANKKQFFDKVTQWTTSTE